MKQKFTFIKSNYGPGNELRSLDHLKTCDNTVFLVSASYEDVIDRWGEKFLNMAMCQGIPTPIVTLMDLESVSPKRRNQVKADVQKRIGKYFPDEKLMLLDKSSDGLNMLRRIGGQKRNEILNKNNRAHLYGDKTELTDDGTLKVTGYLRGIPLNVNGLVHVPGLGTYQMSQIDSAVDPLKTSDEGSSGTQVLARSNPNLQTSLDSENVPDEMDAEQTFPTDAEIDQSMEDNKKKHIKRIPKGMSDYQACWIPDIEEVDENASESESDDDDDNKSFMSCDSAGSPKKEDDEMESAGEGEDEEFEEVSTEVGSTTNNEHKYDEQMDLYEERQAQEKLKAQRTDAQFPDEIDTPINAPARDRFQKYRGLESFRTSPWDVKENLPFDYARIYQFKDFNRIKRRIVKDAANADGDAEPGMYITIYLSSVPKAAWDNFKVNSGSDNVVLYGLLDHENKMSVMNVVLKRAADSTIPIKSKERLIIQCGYRRFVVNPVFSQHTNGKKHKVRSACAIERKFPLIDLFSVRTILSTKLDSRCFILRTDSIPASSSFVFPRKSKRLCDTYWQWKSFVVYT